MIDIEDPPISDEELMIDDVAIEINIQHEDALPELI